jgi:hypothetical protein
LQLETERLLLRPLSLDDLDVFAAFYADPEVMRYLGAGRPLNRDETQASFRRMLRSFELDGFGQLAVERMEDGELVGRCGFLVWNAETLTPTTEAESTGRRSSRSATRSGATFGAGVRDRSGDRRPIRPWGRWAGHGSSRSSGRRTSRLPAWPRSSACVTSATSS